MSAPSLDEVRSIVNEVIRNFESENSEVDLLQDRLIELVESVNLRLRKCDQLLTQGLRGEALQEAEREPSIFDLVAELDFPEWDAWQVQVRSVGLPPQPDLLLDIASELNEAYNQHASIEKLLRQHRVFALARAPLADRIKVLRNIADRDPTNGLWQQDLVAYEKSRCAEIGKELASSYSKKDFVAVDTIYQELHSDGWSVDIPDSLLSTAFDNRQALVSSDSLKRLEGIADKIDSAFAGFNVNATQKLCEQWDKHIGLVRNGPRKQDLEDSVQAAFEWLDDELAAEVEKQAQRRVYDSLIEGIDDLRITKEELQRRMGVCDRFEEPIPARIERRYDQRIREFEQKEKRKTFTTIFSIVSLILVVAGIGVGLFLWQAARNKLKSDVTTLARMLDDSQISQASGFLEKLDPATANTPEIETLRQRLNGIEADESKRLVAFEGFLSPAEQLLQKTETEEQLKTLRKNQFYSVLQGLGRAEGIANGELEMVQLKGCEQKVSACLAEFQLIVDRGFLREFEVVKEAVKQNGELQRIGETGIANLIKTADSLRDKYQDISSEAIQSSQFDLVRRRLLDTRNGIQKDGKLREAMADVKNAVGGSSLKTALQAYVDLEPESGRGSDFKNVIERDLLQVQRVPAEWNQFVTEWNRPTPEVTPKRRVELIGKMASDFSFLPGVATVTPELKEHFKTLAKTDLSVKLKAIENRLSGQEFRLNYIERNYKGDVEKYYFDGAFPSGDSVKLEYQESVRNLAAKASKTFSLDELKTFADQRYAKAPQTIFAEKALSYLKANESDSFESKVIYLIDKLVTDYGDMDAILRTKLILQFTALGRSSSKYLNTGLETFESNLSARTVGARTANYLDPRDRNGRSVRKKCVTALSNQNSPLKKFENSEASKLAELKPPILLKLHFLGIAIKPASRFESVFTPDFDKTLEGDIYAEPAKGLGAVATETINFIKVGSFKDGKLRLNATGGLLEGSPLLLEEVGTNNE